MQRPPRSRFGVLAAAFLLALAARAAPPDAAKYKLKPGAGGKLCLGCHTDIEEAVRRSVVHAPVKGGECADCHDPHASDHGKLLEAEPNAICAKCHPGVASPKDAVSRHAPVVEGRCVLCHDPHASTSPHLLRRAGNELCLECHKELAAALSASQFKHAPVGRNCLECHDPHASRAPALLTKPEPDACVRCHNPTLPVFQKAHLNYPVARSRCTSCHDPHGSSNRGILWASVHKPVLARMCAQCHQDAGGAAPLETRKRGAELCRGCHSTLFNAMLEKNRVHWPVVDAVACARCHTPHASKNAALLVAPQKVLCGSCHAAAVTRAEKSATPHPPVLEGNCTACHAPHASNEAFLLAGSQFDVCGTCHDWKGHSTHPIGEKVADPRNANLTLDCESCHRAHGSPVKHLAHFDTKTELCVQCHAGFQR